jgi:hypothetical protein
MSLHEDNASMTPNFGGLASQRVSNVHVPSPQLASKCHVSQTKLFGSDCQHIGCMQ